MRVLIIILVEKQQLKIGRTIKSTRKHEALIIKNYPLYLGCIIKAKLQPVSITTNRLILRHDISKSTFL